MTIPKPRFHAGPKLLDVTGHGLARLNDERRRLEEAINRTGRRTDGWVTPQEFDAAANGARDDRDAIQAAIDALIDDGGGMLYMPPGTYRIESALNVPNEGNTPVRIVGASRSATTVKYAATSGAALQVQPDNCTIEHITIEGPGNSGDSANGLHLKEDDGPGPKHTTLIDVRILGFGGVGLINDGFANAAFGVFIFNCDKGVRDDGSGGHVALSHGFITGCDTYGIEFAGALTHCALRDVNVELCGTGIFGAGSSAAAKILVLDDCHLERNTDRDVRVGAGTDDLVCINTRFGGVDSRAQNAITHAGSTGSRRRVHLIGCTFLDEDTGDANTEIVNAGQNVDVILDGAEGVQNGLAVSNITLGTDARIVVPGSLGSKQSVSASGNTAIDFADGHEVEVTLTGNVTLTAPSNLIAGVLYYVRFVQDGTGGHTVTFGSNWKNNASIASGADAATSTLWYAVSSSTLAQVGNTQES